MKDLHQTGCFDGQNGPIANPRKICSSSGKLEWEAALVSFVRGFVNLVFFFPIGGILIFFRQKIAKMI